MYAVMNMGKLEFRESDSDVYSDEQTMPVVGVARPSDTARPVAYERINRCVYVTEWSEQEHAGTVPGPAKEPMTLALISCHYGGFNELRRDASIRAFESWDRQRVKPSEGVFLEVVCPGQAPCFNAEDFPSWLRYTRIYGKERNANLFQKEALWNIGAKLTRSDGMLFLDGDCMPVDTDEYFLRMAAALKPGRCVHAAWRIIHEGQDERNHDFWSIMATDVRGKPTFPGMGYAMTRADYDNMDGFNPYSICGSGDMVFLWESVKSLHQRIPFARRFHTGLIRPNRPQLEPYAVSGLTVQHNFHGLKTDRGYVWSRYAVEVFGDPRAYCHIDSAGLLAWNDPKFPLRYIVMEKSRMHSRQELLGLITEVFDRRLREQELLNKEPGYGYDEKDRNIFD